MSDQASDRVVERVNDHAGDRSGGEGSRTAGEPLQYSEYRAVRHFTALDGLRAVSVLLVVLAHARGREDWLWIRGANGVTVFFVLSGYLITTLALREEAVRGTIDLGAFYLRRTFRILPMYYLTLAIYCVLILVLHADPARHDKFVRALPYYLTYLQEWPHLVLKDVPFELSWSLGIEEKCVDSMIHSEIANVVGDHAVQPADAVGAGQRNLRAIAKVVDAASEAQLRPLGLRIAEARGGDGAAILAGLIRRKACAEGFALARALNLKCG